MNQKKRLRTQKLVPIIIVAVLVSGVVIFVTLPSNAKSIDLTAMLSELVGVVQVRNSTKDLYNQVNSGFLLKSKMQLQTKESSRVRMDLSTGSIVRLGPSTIFSLDQQQSAIQGGLSKVELQIGMVWVILKGGSIDVNTPAGLASVRGSYMFVWVEPNTERITVTCLEGHCGFSNKAGDVEMTSGQKIISSNPNLLPGIEKMDQADVQIWLDNSPEAASVVSQISGLVATSTPSWTPTATVTNTSTVSLTPSLTPTTLSSLALLPETATITPTVTPTLITSNSIIYFNTFTPTESNSKHQTAKKKVATRTPHPTGTQAAPTAVNTRVPHPTDTRVVPTDEDTRVPRPTRTHVAPTDDDDDKDSLPARTPMSPVRNNGPIFKFSPVLPFIFW